MHLAVLIDILMEALSCEGGIRRFLLPHSIKVVPVFQLIRSAIWPGCVLFNSRSAKAWRYPDV